MRAIDQLLDFMRRYQLTSLDFATYDRARRLYEHNPVRQREWIEILAESKTDTRIKLYRDATGTRVEAVKAYA